MKELFTLCCQLATQRFGIAILAGQSLDRIIDYEIGSIPPRLDGSDERDDGNLPEYVYADDDIPF